MRPSPGKPNDRINQILTVFSGIFRCVMGGYVIQWTKYVESWFQMFNKYLLLFLVSMIPLVELRGAVILAAGMDIPAVPALLVCMFGNMIPVPFIYFFARKVLIWGQDKKYIGKIFRFCLEKGEKGGQKLVEKTGRGGLFIALLLFVGIPLPGTGAWTGTLAASFLNMGIKSTTISVTLGVAMASAIMYLVSAGVFSVFSFL